MFEALPETREAVRALMNEACSWLKGHGLEAVRTGMGPSFDLPYLLDSYDLLPPISTRQNPPYYHSLLKEARFEAEKGSIDYKIEVTSERIQLWEHMLHAAESRGFEVVTLSELDDSKRVSQFASVWEEAFARHWGMSPQSEDEWEELFGFIGPMGCYDVSVIAYEDDDPVGVVLGIPDLSIMATRASGRERVPNSGSTCSASGYGGKHGAGGVNLAIAARSYLELVKRGNSHLSYTMVLDDNWPSRRTAEKLGGGVCANYSCLPQGSRQTEPLNTTITNGRAIREVPIYPRVSPSSFCEPALYVSPTNYPNNPTRPRSASVKERRTVGGGIA